MSESEVKPYLIRGPPAEDPDKPPVRMEIRDMKKFHPRMWELYLYGLERFQKVDKDKGKDDPFSWFQICGIHGLPYKEWPPKEVEEWNEMQKEADTGFCTHSSILFLPWHRPYLALFEAELYKHVQAVAEERGAEYAEAAKNFRIPYWDWAAQDRTVFPEEVLQKTSPEQVLPGGKLQHNPLAWYEFPDDDSIGDDYKVLNIPKTVRYATSGDTEDEKKQLRRIIDYYNRSDAKGRNLTERTMFILQSYDKFGGMSSDFFWSKERPFSYYGGLEDVHNALHGITGGEGQMSSPSHAAFDPVFWLHHTNIDRLFAIWQALHEDRKKAYTWIEPADNHDYFGTYSRGATKEDENTPFEPFLKSGKGDYWNGTQVRSTKTFGYVYPETKDWEIKTRKELVDVLDKMYPKGSAATLLSRQPGGISDNVTTDIEARAKEHIRVEGEGARATTFQLMAAPPSAIQQIVLPKKRTIQDIAPENKYLEWLVNLRAKKYAMQGHYMVHIFLGRPDDSAPIMYPASPMHVSVFTPFGQGDATRCGRCQENRAAGLEITGQIPLTIALLERYLAGQIDSLTPTHVVPFLQEHLHWRVTYMDGRLASRTDVEDLKVAVVSNEVTVPEDPSALPIYSDVVTPWPEITTKPDGTTPRGNGTGLTPDEV